MLLLKPSQQDVQAAGREGAIFSSRVLRGWKQEKIFLQHSCGSLEHGPWSNIKRVSISKVHTEGTERRWKETSKMAQRWKIASSGTTSGSRYRISSETLHGSLVVKQQVYPLSKYHTGSKKTMRKVQSFMNFWYLLRAMVEALPKGQSLFAEDEGRGTVKGDIFFVEDDDRGAVEGVIFSFFL